MKEEEESSRHKNLREKALKVSIKEGAAANVASSLGDNYMIPLALALKAQPFQIGILSSFSGFLYQSAQLLGSKLMEKRSRKSIVLSFVFLQAMMWMLISLTAFFVWFGLFDGYSVWLIIALYSLSMLFGGALYTPWFSWMGDIIPSDKKGDYLSRRNRIATFFGLISLLAASFFLDYYKTKGLALLALSGLFASAFVFRLISYFLFQKQYSPKFKQKKGDYFSFAAFIRRFDNFGKFSVYHGFFNFAVMIASPFFTVYMLSVLGFSYLQFTLSLVSYYLFYIIFLPVAGRFSDKYGNKKLTIVMNFFYVLTPIIYIFAKSPFAIIVFAQMSAGFSNAAAIIAFSNFIYDAVSPKHRGLCISYTNLLIGFGTLFGALLGGFIVESWHPSFISPYIFVFSITALLRAAVALIFLPQVKEVRRGGRLPTRYNFFFHPINFALHGGIKLMHYPERFIGRLGKSPTLKLGLVNPLKSKIARKLLPKDLKV